MTYNKIPLKTRQQFWEQRARNEGFTYGTEASLSAQLSLPHITAGKHILTIGDAYGRNAVLFAKRGAIVTNIDLCEPWIKEAEKLKNNLQITNICKDVLTTDFPKQSFDVIFSNFVLHFFTDSELKTLFKKISSWLKPSSLFICSWLSDKDASANTAYGGGQHLRHYNKNTLRKTYNQNGFALDKAISLFELETIFNKKQKTNFLFTIASVRK